MKMRSAIADRIRKHREAGSPVTGRSSSDVARGMADYRKYGTRAGHMSDTDWEEHKRTTDRFADRAKGKK